MTAGRDPLTGADLDVLRALARPGLTPAELDVLRALARPERRWWSVTKIADAAVLDHSQVMNALAWLRSLDLATLSTTYGRRWALTTLGADLLDRVTAGAA